MCVCVRCSRWVRSDEANFLFPTFVQMEAAERQARELQEWRAVKEHELAELYEMVEAGQVRA